MVFELLCTRKKVTAWTLYWLNDWMNEWHLSDTTLLAQRIAMSHRKTRNMILYWQVCRSSEALNHVCMNIAYSSLCNSFIYMIYGRCYGMVNFGHPADIQGACHLIISGGGVSILLSVRSEIFFGFLLERGNYIDKDIFLRWYEGGYF